MTTPPLKQSPPPYYNILFVSRQADFQQIKNAYKTLCRIYHPDKCGPQNAFDNQYQQVQVAYQILSDPLLREYYDGETFSQEGLDIALHLREVLAKEGKTTTLEKDEFRRRVVDFHSIKSEIESHKLLNVSTHLIRHSYLRGANFLLPKGTFLPKCAQGLSKDNIVIQINPPPLFWSGLLSCVSFSSSLDSVTRVAPCSMAIKSRFPYFTTDIAKNGRDSYCVVISDTSFENSQESNLQLGTNLTRFDCEFFLNASRQLNSNCSYSYSHLVSERGHSHCHLGIQTTSKRVGTLNLSLESTTSLQGFNFSLDRSLPNSKTWWFSGVINRGGTTQVGLNYNCNLSQIDRFLSLSYGLHFGGVGPTISLKLQRLGQILEIPVQFDWAFNPNMTLTTLTNVLVVASFPLLLALGITNWLKNAKTNIPMNIDDDERRAIKRTLAHVPKWFDRTQKLAKCMAAPWWEAIITQNAIFPIADSKYILERSKHGLVINNAFFGPPSDDDDELLDVTIPLRAMVNESSLTLKGDLRYLPGFYCDKAKPYVLIIDYSLQHKNNVVRLYEEDNNYIIVE